MGKVIRLPRDPHRETQLLLPWYAAGRLDATERARVESHLRACGRCRSELASEHRLSVEVASLPLDADLGWAAMRRRIDASSLSDRARRRRNGLLRAAVPWLGWTAAACVTLVLVGDILTTRPTSGAYHTLSAPAPATPAGNVIVVFRPDATEATIAHVLSASHARIVDGPTGADAYVLRLPKAERDGGVVWLQSQKAIEMAEPIDIPGSP